ncbi:MAG: hypothetical protein RBR87_08080 [Bacteroidales bacterium]|jgi:hypothetical protein|nr:hypothetical protein [Bacteroidales bacterium]
MKLVIERSQDKGFMGGANFILQVRTELTPEEMDIVREYKAQKEQLLTKTVSVLGQKLNLNITIGSLIAGQKFKCKDIGEIMTYEAEVKEACGMFKNYIEVMKSFGGSEVIEF